MHPVRKQRLIVVSLVVVLSSAAVGLVAFALRDNINLFYPPADVVAGKAPVDRSIRLGGMVVEGSIERSETDRHAGAGKARRKLHAARGRGRAGR